MFPNSQLLNDSKVLLRKLPLEMGVPPCWAPGRKPALVVCTVCQAGRDQGNAQPGECLLQHQLRHGERTRGQHLGNELVTQKSVKIVRAECTKYAPTFTGSHFRRRQYQCFQWQHPPGSCRWALLRVSFLCHCIHSRPLFSAVFQPLRDCCKKPFACPSWPTLVNSRQPSLKEIPLASALGPTQHEMIF